MPITGQDLARTPQARSRSVAACPDPHTPCDEPAGSLDLHVHSVTTARTADRVRRDQAGDDRLGDLGRTVVRLMKSDEPDGLTYAPA